MLTVRSFRCLLLICLEDLTKTKLVLRIVQVRLSVDRNNSSIETGFLTIWKMEILPMMFVPGFRRAVEAVSLLARNCTCTMFYI